MSELTPEQRRIRASAKLDDFFSSVEPELKAHVVSLPQRISKMNARRDIKLQEVLNTADRIMAHAASFAACKKGCSHCCYVSVPITDFEARYLGEKINTAPVSIKHSIRRDLNEFSGKTPCLFLKNNACSIYEFRPMTCRIHVNFDIDNYWCLHENWNKPEAAIPKPTIHALSSAYHQLGDKLKPIVADIRDFFPNGKAL
jgi:Fe-S-cluster containining protein